MTRAPMKAYPHPNPPLDGEGTKGKEATEGNLGFLPSRLPPEGPDGTLQGEGGDGGGSQSWDEQRSVESWARICSVDEIPRLGARVIRRPEGPNIAIFRTAVDTFFAREDRCPHRGGPLSQGIVYGERVACPLHNTNVELGSGCAVAPDKGQVRSYRTKVEAGNVYVSLAVSADRYAYG